LFKVVKIIIAKAKKINLEKFSFEFKFIFIIDISSDIKNNIADMKKAEVKKNVPSRKILLPIIKDSLWIFFAIVF
tara:strand:- start:605 stop:829 length:225 start_codon:yes stop_codon:yes gene_type:complete